MFLLIPIFRRWLPTDPCYPPSMGLRCISCPPLSYIRPRCEGGYRLLPLPTRSHRARMIMVACVITTITRHRLSIIWHQHSVAVIIRTADISQLLCRYSTCFPIEQNTSCICPFSRKLIWTCRLGQSICSFVTTFSLRRIWA